MDSKDVSIDVSAYNQRGADYAKAGEHQRAIIEFTHAILLAPDSVPAYYNRALVYRTLGEYNYALDDLQSVILLHSSYAQAYYQRGVTYYLLHEYRRALQDFSRALALNDLDVTSCIGRAMVYLMLREHHQAIINASRAIALQASQAGQLGAYSVRGQAYVALKNYPAAIHDFTQAFSYQPDDAVICNRLGAAYTDSGNPELALAYYNKALALRPLPPLKALTYNNRGEAYRLLARYTEALADFDRALTLNSSLSITYYNRGLTYQSLSLPLRAQADFARSRALDPSWWKCKEQ